MVAASSIRKGLLALVVALALALTAAMVISTTSAQAQPGPKNAYCHSTGSTSNPYVLVVVQAGGPNDVAHQSHLAGGSQERTPPDIFLGEGLTRAEAQVLFDEQCTGTDTTTTTTTGTDTTTTGTDTTTTGTDTTTTGTDTTTTGTDTTTTGTDTTTTGTDTTTTGTGTSTTGETTGATTTGATTSVTTTGDVTQIGNGNVACVQTAVNTEIDKEQIAVSQFGDATNYNIQYISQVCNVTVTQVNTIINEFLEVNNGEVVIVSSATASASASASASAPSAVQYQYSSPSASAAPEETVLPDTGGASLITIGAMVLLLGGGLTAFFVIRR